MAKIYLKKVVDDQECKKCYFEIYSKECDKIYKKYRCDSFHFEKMTDIEILVRNYKKFWAKLDKDIELLKEEFINGKK